MKNKKKNRAQKKFTASTPLYAVLCPKTRNYFLVDHEEAHSKTLRSRFTGDEIPFKERYVQLIPDAKAPRLSLSTVRTIGKHLKSIGGLARAGRVEDFLSFEDFAELATDRAFESPQKLDLPKEFPKSAVKEIVGIGRQADRKAFEDSYYEGHQIGFDVVGSDVVCFQTGRDPGLLLAVPIQANRGPANGNEISATEIAKDIALAVTFMLELLDFIGQFIGLKPNTAKVAEKIGEWLENRRVLQIIRKFIEELRKGIEKNKLYDLLRRLVRDLWDVGGFGDILKEMFSITGWGLAWLILTLLSALVPGAAAVKVIQFVARVAGLAAKVVAATA